MSRTAIEELVLQVLAARHRLGEPYWTFPRMSAITKAVRSLEKKGLAAEQSPHTNGVIEVSATDEGLSEIIVPGYLSPAERRWLRADPDRIIEAIRKIIEGG